MGEFVLIQFASAGRADRVEATVKELDRNLGRLYHDMQEHDELRSLLGLYGVEIEKRLRSNHVSIEHVAARQQAWSEVSLRDREPIRRQVAERAVASARRKKGVFKFATGSMAFNGLYLSVVFATVVV